MNKIQPKASKILSKKWGDRDQAIHKAKLANMKPVICITKPQTHMHLEVRPK